MLIILNPPSCININNITCPNNVKSLFISIVDNPVTQTPLKDVNSASISEMFPQQGSIKSIAPIKQSKKNVIKITLADDFSMKFDIWFVMLNKTLFIVFLLYHNTGI